MKLTKGQLDLGDLLANSDLLLVPATFDGHQVAVVVTKVGDESRQGLAVLAMILDPELLDQIGGRLKNPAGQSPQQVLLLTKEDEPANPSDKN